MEPRLHDGEFVFCTVSPAQFRRLRIEPLGWFREEEGITLIAERSVADRDGLKYEFISRMITLSVHSSLYAVGFLAAITTKLAAAGISVNPISAYYHDHLFVPADQASAAMKALDELRGESVLPGSA
jgi:hypothetical protein